MSMLKKHFKKLVEEKNDCSGCYEKSLREVFKTFDIIFRIN